MIDQVFSGASMHRVIQTILGCGNKYDDLACLWFEQAQSRPSSPSETTFDGFADAVGLSALQNLDVRDANGVRTAFLDSLTAKNPQPGTGDALRWIAELSAPLSDFTSRQAFVSEFTSWVAKERPVSLAEWQRQNESDLMSHDPDVLKSNIEQAFELSEIVVSQSPPSAASIVSLLSKGSGVAIGGMLGMHLVHGYSPVYLCLAVPGGMLICSTAAGIADALQMGLRQRVLAWILGVSDRNRRTAAQNALDSLFPRTAEAARTDAAEKEKRR